MIQQNNKERNGENEKKVYFTSDGIGNDGKYAAVCCDTRR